jgi:single-strand DNA-binding protein
MDLNRATIIGRLTQDPQLRTTTNGKTVASLSVATNRSWVDQTGTRQDKPEYHDCVLWGKLGEIAGQYLTKGRQVYIEGRLQTRSWEGQDGKKNYRTEIVAENLIMLGGRGGSNDGPVPSAGNMAPPAPPSTGADEIKVEDIPF